MSVHTTSSTGPVPASSAHHAKQPACANCDYQFPEGGPDEYCPRCGQQNHEVNIGFGHVLEETLEGIFHFDSKVFRTAKLLLFKPGRLTRQFLEGHRVPYVPPIRLYIFISFVFFFLLSLQAGKSKGKTFKDLQEASRTQPLTAADSVRLDSARAQLSRLDSARRVYRVRPSGTFELMLGGVGISADSSANGGDADFTLPLSDNQEITGSDVRSLPEHPTPAQIDSVIHSKGVEPSFYSRLAVKRAVRWRDATLDEVIHQGLRGLSIMMFLLMPLAALLLKVFYFRQHRHYISHLIFTVHVHCFLFLYLGLGIALNYLPIPTELPDISGLLLAVYFIVALRTMYQQSWGKTIFKSLLLGFSYSFVLLASVVLVGLLGAAMF